MGFYLGRFGEEFLDGRCSVSVVRGFAFTVALVTNFPLIELRRTILVPPLAIGFPPWVKLSNPASAIRKCGSAKCGNHTFWLYSGGDVVCAECEQEVALA
jgi:hypothetical protein